MTQRRTRVEEDTVRLGERLRRVRQQQGLALQEVEEQSGGELKASVVGAYERAERAVSIVRLHTLAQFYRVPVTELLPEAGATPPSVDPGSQPRREIIIDLAALERQRDAEPVLTRYARSIQQRRGDYNGRVLTVRGGDLDMLAAVMDLGSDELWDRLATAGVVR